MIESKCVDQIFKDYDAMIGGDVILHPFREEIVRLEKEGFKVGRVANLFSLLAVRVVGTDPDGVRLLRRMQQIPMVEILGSHGEQDREIAVFLRKVDEEKAIVYVGEGGVELPDGLGVHPEFGYIVDLLFSEKRLLHP